jgi:glycosyltransferase involved in cell wall biosynthesis
MIAAELSRTPWSLTVHRWDITENNLLRRKAASACFVRSISRIGFCELRRLTDSDARLTVLNMGVPTEPVASFRRPADKATSQLRILMAANFVEVKGHRYLLAGVALLQDRGCDVRVDLAGDGPLRSAMLRRAQELGIAARTSFLGQLSHGTLLAELRAGTWDIAILTSVETASDEREGIPVSLIEAMSCEVPVVATSVGGVPELLEGGAGLLVPQRDAMAVADAIESLMSDPERRRELASAGRRRVEAQFAIERVVPRLVERFEECSGSFGGAAAEGRTRRPRRV